VSTASPHGLTGAHEHEFNADLLAFLCPMIRAARDHPGDVA
jgi:hypothetical protein